MTADELEALAKRTAADLGEHFDVVLILAAKADDNGQGGDIFTHGTGLGCARVGLAIGYAERWREQTRSTVRPD